MELQAALGARGRDRVALALAVAAVAGGAGAPPAARAQEAAPSAGSSPGLVDLVPVDPRDLDRVPRGRVRSARAVLAVARRVPKVRDLRGADRPDFARAYLKGSAGWQVSFFARRAGGDEEVAQVLVDDRSGRVLEAWTGIQVAWTMARGYPGAFGRRAAALYVWLPLLVLFLLPFLRPPWRLLHLDLAALAAFSASFAVFSAGRIDVSVPLAYPPLAYLLVRLLLLSRSGARAERSPLPLVVGPTFLAVAVVFLIGFRVGLNVSASNVIDVGYAGVIGADRITGGEPLYGRFPADNPHGDTYGPANYLAYVPFELLAPWRGEWDGLPAAHAAAVTFDLLVVGLLWLIGRRLAKPRLGLLLAYLWLAYPFTLLVVNSNANDALVTVLVLAALLALGRPLARGALVAAAGLTKLAPLALLPLVAGQPARPVGVLARGPDGRGLVASRPRAAALTAGGAALAAAILLGLVAVMDGGLGLFFERTFLFQAERESPFSIWGLHELGGLQRAVQAAAVLLALAVAVRPRATDLPGAAALAGAVLIALQLGVTHWFHFYVVWFMPLVLLAVLGRHGEPAVAQPEAGRSTGSIDSARPRSSQRMTTAMSHGSSSAVS